MADRLGPRLHPIKNGGCEIMQPPADGPIPDNSALPQFAPVSWRAQPRACSLGRPMAAARRLLPGCWSDPDAPRRVPELLAGRPAHPTSVSIRELVPGGVSRVKIGFR
jgi:hypothetical protein